MIEDCLKNAIYKQKMLDVFKNNTKVGEVLEFSRRLGKTDYGTTSFMVNYTCEIGDFKITDGYLSNVINNLKSRGFTISYVIFQK